MKLLPYLGVVGLLVGSSACTTEEQVTEVTFVLDEGLVIDPEICNFIDVTIWYTEKANEYERLSCDQTSFSLRWTDTPDLIQVRYWYTEIPFGCEEMACWHDATMASGDAPFDPNAAELRVDIQRVIGSPF